MKKSIFDQQTNKALMSWHKNALNKKKDGKPSAPATRTLGDSSDSPPSSHSNMHDMSNDGGQTANIVASVDIDGGGEHPHSSSDPNNSQSGSHNLI